MNLDSSNPPAMIPATLPYRRAEPLFTNEQWLTVAERLEFSKRESEIVRLVFEGAVDQAIAKELAMSVNTVQTHLKRMYSKLGVVNRVGMVLQVVREHLALSMDARRDERIVPFEPGWRVRRLKLALPPVFPLPAISPFGCHVFVTSPLRDLQIGGLLP